MRKLTVFNFISLDGMYKGPDGGIEWHRHGEEEGEYSAQSLQADDVLLFGRITYEMMASWWPTPMAAEAYPEVAAGMNSAEKIVFSNTLEAPRWENTIAMDGDIIGRIREMKQQPGKDMTILGSGTIVSQFAEAGLIDEYLVMLDPVLLGGGTAIFSHAKQRMELKLTGAPQVFKSGAVLLTYKP